MRPTARAATLRLVGPSSSPSPSTQGTRAKPGSRLDAPAQRYWLRVAMTEKVSTIDVRQRIGDLLNRVALRHDEFVIERKGKPLAALVPIERLEQMRRFARRHALGLLEERKANAMTEEQTLDIALEAQRSARKPPRKRRRAR